MAIEQHRPESLEAWRKLRRQDITASEIGGLLPGVHPYRTAYRLFAEKTGRLAPDDELDTPAMARGRALEPLAVQMVAEAMPDAKLEHNAERRYWRDPLARIGATPDLLVEDPERGPGVVQLKSIEPSVYARAWHGGEPPLWIALQALTEAQLVGAKWAAVGALRVGHGLDFDLTPIPMPVGAWARLVAETAMFWRMVELNQPPAPDFGRDTETIARLNQVAAGTSIDLSDDADFCAAVVERERLKRAAKEFEQRCDVLEGIIRHRAGEHELILAGNYQVSLKMVPRAGYTVAPSESRQLRIKRLDREIITS